MYFPGLLLRIETGTEEMDQWLKAISALPGDIGSILSIHMVINNLL